MYVSQCVYYDEKGFTFTIYMLSYGRAYGIISSYRYLFWYINCECVVNMSFSLGPINREMRNLITSLKNHNEQLKGEVARYKRKLKEAQTEISKVCFKHRKLILISFLVIIIPAFLVTIL